MAKVTPANTFVKYKGRKNEVSKRIALVAAFALALLLAFTASVLAAQNSSYSGSPQDGVVDFAATPTNQIYLPNADPSQYKIHSNYTATTDACASCHSTHTAVGGALLQLGSSTDICMACHDGSVTTTYDVQDGLIGNTTMPTSGGMFGDTNTDPQTNLTNSVSTHNVSGSISIYAAPGGPGTPGISANNPDNPWDPKISWNQEAPFGCESCHSPHGTGGNARILNPDVNGYAEAAYKKGHYNASGGGKNVGGSQGVPLLKAADGTYYSNWKNVDSTEKDQWLWSGYPYKSNTKVYVDGALKALDVDYTLDNTQGYTNVTFKTSLPGDAVVTADFYPGLVVKMNISNYLQTSEKVQHVSGLNDFCGACHTDYNTSDVTDPATKLNGTYTEAYRHKVDFTIGNDLKDKLAKYNMPLEAKNGKNYATCETCHVAHGTNSKYWEDTLKVANGGTLPTGLEASNLKELSGSSALKRIPNMGTCEACHAKGLAAQGNPTATNVSAPTATTSTTPGGGYVGSQACKTCHSNVSEHFSETWHSSMSRPGVTKATWDSVKGQLVNADGSFNTAYASSLDAKSTTGFAKALFDTMTELAGKNMFDSKGAIITDPAVWKAKGINADKIKVWTTGTTKQEIAVKGSAIGKTGVDGDKWFIVTNWGRGANPTDFTKAEEEDYTCGTTALGCHTTGKTTDNGSADMTAWLKAAVTGTQPFELGVTCETCHGQGGNHTKAPSAKNIVNPANFSPVEQSVGLGATKVGNTWSASGASKFLNQDSLAMSCGKCHSGGRHQGDYYSAGTYAESSKTFVPSEHFTSGKVGCNSCHEVHRENKGLMAFGTAQQTCESCHGTLTNFNLSDYMPALDRDADLHEHQYQTGVAIPYASNQSQEGRLKP